MTNASTLTRWVPRPTVGVACSHTLFALPASPHPDPLVGVVDDGFVDGKVNRAAVALPTP